MNITNKRSKPPKIAESLMKKILPDYVDGNALGDYEEVFASLINEKGYGRALVWYIKQILRTIPDIIRSSISERTCMLKNYLKIALRNFNRHKSYSFINIFGLTLGITSFIFISLYIKFELSFDEYHSNSENIYRIAMEDHAYLYMNSYKMAQTHPALATLLIQDFPDVRSATRFWSNDNIRIIVNNESFYEDNFLYIDTEFLKVFSLDIFIGEKEAVFNDPSLIIISERIAEKYFPDKDPVGEVINFEGVRDFRVTGVLKDLPENSHFDIDFLVSVENQRIIYDRDINTWNSIGCYTYVLLIDEVIRNEFESRLSKLPELYFYENDQQHQHRQIKYSLQPLTSIHLHSHLNFELENNGDIRFVYIFSTIAFLILVIACINYVNLATARSAKRGKEVGIRKVVGAFKKQLIKQFILESFIFSSLSLLLSLIAVYLVLPYFSNFVGREIAFDLEELIVFSPWFVLLLLSVVFLAGSYPAFFISSFKPVSLFNDKLKSSSNRSNLRSLLVIIQFVVSIVLIISTLVINNQLKYLRNKETGYNKEKIITINLRDRSLIERKDALKNELLNNPQIVSVSSSTQLPNDINWQYRIHYPGMPDDFFMAMNFCIADNDFIDLYGLEIKEGRKFSDDFLSDKDGAFILNEAAVKALGWEPAVGREFDIYLDSRFNTGKIVGVVKDFHLLPLHNQIQPLYLYSGRGSGFFRPRFISIKIRGENIEQTVEFIRERFLEFSPHYPFEYSFFDEVFDSAYRSEQRLSIIFNSFSIIAVIIACMGLLGLTIFTAEQKYKEIGIRKVMGASAPKIIFLLTKQYSKWIIISNILALPLSYYLMNVWLQNFAYRIELGIPLFLSAALITMFIALITVSYQSVKAA
ncbi:ABC transporter permease, partial [candidate division KSB1 bacterium]